MLFQVTNYSLGPKMIPQYPPDFEDQILSTSFWWGCVRQYGILLSLRWVQNGRFWGRKHHQDGLQLRRHTQYLVWPEIDESLGL